MNTYSKKLFKATLMLAILLGLASCTPSEDDKVTDMVTQPEPDKLVQVIAGTHRASKNSQRDIYRHPLETLQFFGIKDDMTVVEISPGSGWYTEILAPYLKENGVYIAASYDPESKVEYYRNNAKKFQDKLAANPELYGKTQLGIMQTPDLFKFAEEGTVDMVLSFRNTHNWYNAESAEAVYAAIFKSLKTGGTFGLVQHRAGHIHPEDSSGKKGYLRQPEVIKLAEKVGFRLVDKSDVNANPKDTRDYENGVWTLPPSYRLKEVDKEKYQAIGESDRMTLKFVKPHSM